MGVGVKKVQISLVKPSCLNSQFFNSDEQIISGGGDLVGKGGGRQYICGCYHILPGNSAFSPLRPTHLFRPYLSKIFNCWYP